MSKKTLPNEVAPNVTNGGVSLLDMAARLDKLTRIVESTLTTRTANDDDDDDEPQASTPKQSDLMSKLQRKIEKKRATKATSTTSNGGDDRMDIQRIGKLAGDTVNIGHHDRYGYGVLIGQYGPNNRPIFHRSYKWIAVIRLIQEHGEAILKYMNDHE